MMRFILETLSLACFAKVNPFDQPAVESSKQFMERFL
jgi:glucose-6-phosphate isomerase